MHRCAVCKGVFLLLVVALCLPPALARTYKWTDDEGNVHYSDSVPPEEARQRREREVKSDSGLTVERIEPPPTLDEMEALERQREAEAERDRAAAERAERDRNLLMTFQDVEQMREAREERLAAIEGQIALTRSRIRTLDERIERRREDAARLERSGGGDPEAVYEEIEELRQRLELNRGFAQRQLDEQERIREQFERDIQRFRELTEGG